MRKRHEPEQRAEQPQLLSAFVKETFNPTQLNVVGHEADLGEEPRIELDLFIGQIAPDLFLTCKSATLTPDVAIQIGEYLASEGRRVRSGLVKAGAVDLANLRETG